MGDSEFTHRRKAPAHVASRLPERSPRRQALPHVPALTLLGPLYLRYAGAPQQHANSKPTI
jgi:hypothetical protein